MKTSHRELNITVNGAAFQVTVLERSQEHVKFVVADRVYEVRWEQRLTSISPTGQKNSPIKKVGPTAKHEQAVPGLVVAPIPGLVVNVRVSKGQLVAQGDIILQLEAMKMENSIFAPCSGTIEEIFVNDGEEVGDHQPLLRIQPAESA